IPGRVSTTHRPRCQYRPGSRHRRIDTRPRRGGRQEAAIYRPPSQPWACPGLLSCAESAARGWPPTAPRDRFAGRFDDLESLGTEEMELEIAVPKSSHRAVGGVEVGARQRTIDFRVDQGEDEFLVRVGVLT